MENEKLNELLKLLALLTDKYKYLIKDIDDDTEIEKITFQKTLILIKKIELELEEKITETEEDFEKMVNTELLKQIKLLDKKIIIRFKKFFDPYNPLLEETTFPKEENFNKEKTLVLKEDKSEKIIDVINAEKSEKIINNYSEATVENILSEKAVPIINKEDIENPKQDELVEAFSTELISQEENKNDIDKSFSLKIDKKNKEIIEELQSEKIIPSFAPTKLDERLIEENDEAYVKMVQKLKDIDKQNDIKDIDNNKEETKINKVDKKLDKNKEEYRVEEDKENRELVIVVKAIQEELDKKLAEENKKQKELEKREKELERREKELHLKLNKLQKNDEIIVSKKSEKKEVEKERKKIETKKKIFELFESLAILEKEEHQKDIKMKEEKNKEKTSEKDVKEDKQNDIKIEEEKIKKDVKEEIKESQDDIKIEEKNKENIKEEIKEDTKIKEKTSEKDVKEDKQNDIKIEEEKIKEDVKESQDDIKIEEKNKENIKEEIKEDIKIKEKTSEKDVKEDKQNDIKKEEEIKEDVKEEIKESQDDIKIEEKNKENIKEEIKEDTKIKEKISEKDVKEDKQNDIKKEEEKNKEDVKEEIKEDTKIKEKISEKDVKEDKQNDIKKEEEIKEENQDDIKEEIKESQEEIKEDVEEEKNKEDVKEEIKEDEKFKIINENTLKGKFDNSAEDVQIKEENEIKIDAIDAVENEIEEIVPMNIFENPNSPYSKEELDKLKHMLEINSDEEFEKIVQEDNLDFEILNTLNKNWNSVRKSKRKLSYLKEQKKERIEILLELENLNIKINDFMKYDVPTFYLENIYESNKLILEIEKLPLKENAVIQMRYGKTKDWKFLEEEIKALEKLQEDEMLILDNKITAEKYFTDKSIFETKDLKKLKEKLIDLGNKNSKFKMRNEEIANQKTINMAEEKTVAEKLVAITNEFKETISQKLELFIKVESALDNWGKIYNSNRLTLEECGILFELTKERIRQIENSALGKLRKHYKRKYINKRFLGVSPLYIQIYNVNLNKEEELGYKDIYTNEYFQNKYNILLEETIYYGQKVKKKAKDLFSVYWEKQQIAESQSIEEIEKEFVTSLKKAKINIPIEDIRVIEGFLKRNEVNIKSNNFKYRYWNHSVAELIKVLEKAIEDAPEIFSTKLIFDNQKKIMETYDIRDYYELHYILKKNADKLPENLTFERTPHIKKGTLDLVEWLTKEIDTKREITKEIKRVANKTGILEETINGSYISKVKFNKFVENTSEKLENNEKFQNIEKNLNPEINVSDEIKIKYHLSEEEERNFLLYIKLKKDKYTVNGHWILDKKYKNSRDYIERNTNNENIFKEDNLGEIVNLEIYKRLIQSLEKSREYFYQDKGTLIRIRKEIIDKLEKLDNEINKNIEIVKEEIDNKKKAGFRIADFKNLINKISKDEYNFTESFWKSYIISNKNFIYSPTKQNIRYNSNQI